VPKVLAVLVVLAACGGGSSSSSPAEYPDQLHEAFCRHYVKCGEIADLDSCLAANIGVRFRISASEQAAYDAMKLAFDADSAKACTDAIADASCDVTSQSARVLPAACGKVSTGKQPGGAACAVADECVSHVCDVPLCNDKCCQGTCVGDAAPAIAKAGDPCDAGPCEPAAYCDDSMTCVTRKNAGAACILSDECQFGLDCDPESNTCAPLPALGAACTGACRDAGTRCSATTQRCVKAALEHEACTMTEDCSPFYVCDATQHCAAGLALGAPCSKFQRCAGDGAFCEVASGMQMGTCTLPIAIGQPCASNNSCDSLTCDPIANLCAAEPVCI